LCNVVSRVFAAVFTPGSGTVDKKCRYNSKKNKNRLTFSYRYDNQVFSQEYTMNKKEIAESIYKKLEIKRFEAYSFIDLLVEAIVDCLESGEKVVISNFGTFKVVDRKKKKVISPKDNQYMVIPERKIVKFLPSKSLKEAVRGNR
jgi:nucleoid DNA-binding protein